MSSFRTEIRLNPASFELNYNDVMMSLGSCFSAEIGDKLISSKFNILINPFGVLYNPMSIKRSIGTLLSKDDYCANNIVENNGVWQSFDFHSSFSSIHKVQCSEHIQSAIKLAKAQLSRLNALIITFGTAFYYKHKETGTVVANCHKFPTTDFSRHRLNIQEIVGVYQELIEQLKSANHQLKIIFTLSPVRHLKDGFEENQISKAILRLAIDKICNTTSNVHYFPSYEMVMDDLRDYRFYKGNLTHPNEIAVNYIWGKFQACYFSAETIATLQSAIELVKAANHQPIIPDSAQHLTFKRTMLAKVLKLQTKHPEMNWDQEIKLFDD